MQGKCVDIPVVDKNTLCSSRISWENIEDKGKKKLKFNLADVVTKDIQNQVFYTDYLLRNTCTI